MLKIALNQEEREGAHLMTWWAGEGAARILAHEREALLLERATGERSLATMARGGQDDAASAILCGAVARLHAPRAKPPPTTLAPLPVWFRQLAPAAASHGGVLVNSAAAAAALLASPREAAVLHGDIHHDNVLDFGPRGWLAIDPKGLFGERASTTAICSAIPISRRRRRRGGWRGARRRWRASGIEPRRLLRWVLAYAGLSASWTIDDGGDPSLALAIAQIAAAVGEGLASQPPVSRGARFAHH